MPSVGRGMALLAGLLLLAGCNGERADPAAKAPAVEADHEVLVYQNPQCGCCGKWVDYMREQGFEVRVLTEQDIVARRRQLGVPDHLASCHTAVVSGYLIEGHVPAGAVRQLLEERPEIAGLSVPGMPVGSPGMEMGEREDTYPVIAFDQAGDGRLFARYRGHRLLEE